MTFYIGGTANDDGDRVEDSPTHYDPSDLTTHGVIVGMTGSGKTGLGVIFLEEALRSGVPTLIIDPKGDMTNLLLTFPELAPSDFRPWIDEAAAAKDGRSPDQEAAAEAEKWEKGLGWWGLSSNDIGALRSEVDMTIYTPGSDAGTPLNVIGNLAAPALSWDSESEALRDEIEGFVSGLLGLVDIAADPISSREHILLSNLVEHSWRRGASLDIATLIQQVATPPMRKLGVFEVDTFFPQKDRMELAMKLNGLLASPSFAAWMEGDPLDVESLLWRDGRPQASILYVAHLSDAERQFIVTMVLSKVITWMRSQAGSGELRALVYMDEVFGYVPPTAEPPSKKPILTMLKQARAFGVGLLLSTQNPVDLDYKAMSNAGTWCIGRLQTERDKARIMEALTSASGDVDTRKLDSQISGLAKRVFLLHNTHEPLPQLFTTRWAMSYLRGPMTREEIGRFTPEAMQPQPTTPTPPSPGIQIAEPQAQPVIAEGIESVALHPAATWAETVGLSEDGEHYEAAVAFTVQLRFDESRLKIDQDERWEAVLHPVGDRFDPVNLSEVDHDPRDFVEPAPEIPFVPPQAALSQSSYFRSLRSDLKKHLDKSEVMVVLHNKTLKAASRPDESVDTFRLRLDALAGDRADLEISKLRDSYQLRLRKAERARDDAMRAAETAEDAVDDAKWSDRVKIAGSVVDFLSGRKVNVPKTSGRTAKDRMRRAGDKADLKAREIEDLEADLFDEMSSIQAKWSDIASDFEQVEIGLEANDIEIIDTRVVWIRTG